MGLFNENVKVEESEIKIGSFKSGTFFRNLLSLFPKESVRKAAGVGESKLV